jgi:hypothetical protein
MMLFGVTCFAASSTSGSTNANNAVRIVIQGPSNSKLIFDKMPSFKLTFKTSNGKSANGTMVFCDGNTGNVISSRSVYGGTTFIPPGERRRYIVVFIPSGNQNIYWSVKKNNRVFSTYNYEVYPMRYHIGAVG